MKALLIRTKMIGGGNSYDVYFPKEEINHQLSHTTIISGKHYASLDELYIDNLHKAMSPGIERYKKYLKLEKKAKIQGLELIQKEFPETKVLKEFPLLWTVLNKDYPSKKVFIIFEKEE